MKFDSRLLDATHSQLALVRDGKEEPLVVGQDGSLNARGELNGSAEAPLVFVGYGLSIPDAAKPGLFKRMLTSDKPVHYDFRAAFELARTLTA